jgi:hypothetical protein
MNEPKPKTVDVTLGIMNYLVFNKPNSIADYGLSFRPCSNAVNGRPICVSIVSPNLVIQEGDRQPEKKWILKKIEGVSDEAKAPCPEYPTLEQVSNYLKRTNYTEEELNKTQQGRLAFKRRFIFEIPAKDEGVGDSASASSNSGKDDADINMIQSPSNVMGSVDISKETASGGGGGSVPVVSNPSSDNPVRSREELAADWKSRKPALGITIGAGEDEAMGPLNKPSPTNLGPATSSSAATATDTSSSAATISTEPPVPISKNFLQMSDIVLDPKGENKGRVVLNNKLVYFGPIQVIDDPVICSVIKTDGTERPYSINIIKINNQGRVQQGENPVPNDDIEWDAIALPKIIDPQQVLESKLPKDAEGNEIQWVSYVMYDIFSSFPNSKNTNVDKDPKTVFGNELFQGFFNAEYNEDVMFNKANLKRLQRQTFKDLVIYFNALMETLEHIYTHSISSVVNPEKKLCLKDLPKSVSASGASGSSSASASGASGSSSASGSDDKLLNQIEKLYNEGKMKEIAAMSDKITSVSDRLKIIKISIYYFLSLLETGNYFRNESLNTLYEVITSSISIISTIDDPKEKTKYTRLIFKILFYTYQDDTIQQSQIIDLTTLASNLDIVYHANTIKQQITNGIDTENRDASQKEAEDSMAKYALEITAAEKTDYEKEISDTTAAAQKAKADLKWTLAELLFKRAYQLAVVYFGYGSEEEGAAKSQMEKFSELNNKHGSKLIKFVGNLKTQLEMPGSVYSEFLNTDDNNKPPIIADKKDIPKNYKDEIETVIKAQMASRTTSKLFEVTPTEEIQKQLPGAIIGTLSGIISNMIIQMTLYIYIVNQLRIKEIDDEGQGPLTMDNNEIILLFNILAGLKIAQQRIIELSAEQNQNNDDDDQINISDGTQVDSAFLNKLMGSVLASGSMLGVLAAVGGKKRRTKKHRRAKGLKSRRLINSNSNSKNRRYKKGRGRGITRRELRKVKTSRKLRK